MYLYCIVMYCIALHCIVLNLVYYQNALIFLSQIQQPNFFISYIIIFIIYYISFHHFSCLVIIYTAQDVSTFLSGSFENVPYVTMLLSLVEKAFGEDTYVPYSTAPYLQNIRIFHVLLIIAIMIGQIFH